MFDIVMCLIALAAALATLVLMDWNEGRRPS